MLPAVDSHRPAKLYIYSQRLSLERSLELGEFRLQQAVVEPKASQQIGGEQILPFRNKAAAAAQSQNYLILSLATAWDEKKFNADSGVDCCLIIHNPEDFGERLHRATQRALPNWAGIDAAISYGAQSPLGAAFTKPKSAAMEKEWLFAWRPMQPVRALHPLVIQIGSIASIAELCDKPV